MKLAVMQPYLFSYIGYFQLINSVDKFVILDDVNYIMKGWINRNRILVNGKGYMFTFPLKKVTQNKKIFEFEFATDIPWVPRFLKTIEYNYKKAPFFNDTIKIIENIFSIKETNLSKWLTYQIKILCNYLEIGTEIIETSRIYNNQFLKAQEKIIDICKKEKASTYINSIGGTDLYQPEAFSEIGCELKFLKSHLIEYNQFNKQFVPFLSIIDVMMFNDIVSIKKLLNKFELI